jgi:hypothetical protein
MHGSATKRISLRSNSPAGLSTQSAPESVATGTDASTRRYHPPQRIRAYAAASAAASRSVGQRIPSEQRSLEKHEADRPNRSRAAEARQHDLPHERLERKRRNAAAKIVAVPTARTSQVVPSLAPLRG